MEKTLALSDYRALAELRYQIRLFLRFSEEAASIQNVADRVVADT